MARVAPPAARNRVATLNRASKSDEPPVPATHSVLKRGRLIGRAERTTLILSPVLPEIKETPYETLDPVDHRPDVCGRRRSPCDARIHGRHDTERIPEILEDKPRPTCREPGPGRCQLLRHARAKSFVSKP